MGEQRGMVPARDRPPPAARSLPAHLSPGQRGRPGRPRPRRPRRREHEAVLDDLAYGRVTGKVLGARHVSGDLTGLARVKFDTPDQRPQRFRLLYRQVNPTTLDVLAIGARDQHAIYRTAANRIGGSGPADPNAPQKAGGAGNGAGLSRPFARTPQRRYVLL